MIAATAKTTDSPASMMTILLKICGPLTSAIPATITVVIPRARTVAATLPAQMAEITHQALLRMAVRPGLTIMITPVAATTITTAANRLR